MSRSFPIMVPSMDIKVNSMVNTMPGCKDEGDLSVALEKFTEIYTNKYDTHSDACECNNKHI